MSLVDPEPRPDGPVHYQISITARQAAGFFVALLVSLGLAFFFGMKTGAAAKRSGDASGRVAAVSDLPVVPTAVPIEEPVEKRDEDRKLGFDKAKPTPAEKASLSEPPRPAAEEPKPTATAVPPKPTAEPKPTRAPEKVAEKAPAEKPAEKAAADKAAEKPAKAPAEKGTEKSSPPRKDAWYLQVYASKSVGLAEKLAERLRQAKLKCDVSTDPSGSGFYRVRVGPFAEKAQAEAARKKVLEVDKTLKDAKLVHL